MKVKDLVGKKFTFKVDQVDYGCTLFVAGEYGEPASGVDGVFRVVIDDSVGTVPILTISYFETDESGKIMEEDGEVIKAEKTFAITGWVELNIGKEFKPDDLTDAA